MKGSVIIIITLVMGGVFVMLGLSISSLVLIQKKSQYAKEAREQALQAAEAGLNYYKWRLAHFPDDLTDGTGEEGPYEHTFDDPEGGTIGGFSLTIGGESQCGQITNIDITSKGYSLKNPEYTRTVYGKYARPSVAEYSFILNSSVWAGNDRIIFGPYHSNAGVRMDGDNRSTVTSALQTWQCTSTFGCSPTATKNGVFGSGTNPSLWEFPVPSVDFAGITVDLASMKTLVQTEGGLYYPPSSRGYHIRFNSDGTMTVWRVTNTSSVWSYNQENASSDGWVQDPQIIASQTLLGTVAIPSDCSVVFVEDNLWIEGVVNGRVTVAAANVTSSNITPRVILNNNITYASTDGSDGLTVIAEGSVIVPLISPNIMEVRGVYIAQTGRFSRDHYVTTGSRDVPEAYNSYVIRDTMIMHGTIVSNGRVGTRWVCGGNTCSGYSNRENYYDRKLASNPPPLTPATSDDYRFIEWREQN